MEKSIIKIFERVVERMDNEKHSYQKETKLDIENGIDSLALMNILIEIESEYDIYLDEYMMEISKAKNIGDIVDVVRKIQNITKK